MDDSKRLVKLAVIGAGGVGKTTIISRLSTGAFIEESMTVGFDVDTWTFCPHEGCSPVKATLFDFGGQEQFRFFQGSLITGSKIALLVFDCSSYISFTNLDEWMKMVETIPSGNKILVGNKIDVGNSVSEQDIKEFVDKHDLRYVIISSKTGENFKQLESLISEIVCNIELHDVMKQNN